MRPGSIFMSVRIRGEKKKGKVGTASSQEVLNSQLTWQVQSHCCHLHSMPLLGPKTRADSEGKAMTLMPTFSIGQKTEAKSYFSNKKFKRFILLSQAYLLSYCSK